MFTNKEGKFIYIGKGRSVYNSLKYTTTKTKREILQMMFPKPKSKKKAEFKKVE